jgi:hypothetical protein
MLIGLREKKKICWQNCDFDLGFGGGDGAVLQGEGVMQNGQGITMPVSYYSFSSKACFMAVAISNAK